MQSLPDLNKYHTAAFLVGADATLRNVLNTYPELKIIEGRVHSYLKSCESFRAEELMLHLAWQDAHEILEMSPEDRAEYAAYS